MNEEVVFEDIKDKEHIPALHKKNALLHNPFAWDEDAEGEG